MPTPDQINQAAAILTSGGLVAFPTETVYGLGADAENPAAVAAIYHAKGRPANHPVIVHVAPEADLQHWVSDVPEQATRLISAFWPGPLTLILHRAPNIPDAVSGGQDSIGIRCPSHPVAIALLRAFKGGQGGIAAPSANKFGRVSPTLRQHVVDEFRTALEPGGAIGMVLEGGQSEVGIESTIVDLTRLDTVGPVLLRPGHISLDQLEQVLGVRPLTAAKAAGVQASVPAPRASGTLDAHYAPITPVVIVPTGKLDATLQALQHANRRVALLHYLPINTAADVNIRLDDDAAGYAQQLYASLRKLDLAVTDVIVVQAPPEGVAWHGVRDRLTRAAHDSAGVLGQLLG